MKFSLFCSKMFTLSSEIKLNLFQISPLKTPAKYWEADESAQISNIWQLWVTVNAVNFAGLIFRVWQHKNIFAGC